MYFPDGVWRLILNMRKALQIKHHWKSCYDSVMGELSLRGLTYLNKHWNLGPSLSYTFLNEIEYRKMKGAKCELVPFHVCYACDYHYGGPKEMLLVLMEDLKIKL